jgi:TetR/AcrR family transcriptional regulator, repressor for uid operon
MSLAETAVVPPPQDRKNRILDAAERCFALTGFHKATMQDVATECGMSPGNLYRYFASKDDVVAGMAERDRERFMADVVHLKAAPDPRATFEGARNPRIGDICRFMDTEVHGIMTAFVEHWRRTEGVSAPTPAADVASLMMILSDGIFRRRANSVAFDALAAFDIIYPIVLQAIGVPQNSVHEVA